MLLRAIGVGEASMTEPGETKPLTTLVIAEDPGERFDDGPPELSS